MTSETHASGDTTETSNDQQLQDRVNNRSQRPNSQAFKQFMASQWAAAEEPQHEEDAVAEFARRRRRSVYDTVDNLQEVLRLTGKRLRTEPISHLYLPFC